MTDQITLRYDLATQILEAKTEFDKNTSLLSRSEKLILWDKFLKSIGPKMYKLQSIPYHDSEERLEFCIKHQEGKH